MIKDRMKDVVAMRIALIRRARPQIGRAVRHVDHVEALQRGENAVKGLVRFELVRDDDGVGRVLATELARLRRVAEPAAVEVDQPTRMIVARQTEVVGRGTVVHAACLRIVI